MLSVRSDLTNWNPECSFIASLGCDRFVGLQNFAQLPGPKLIPDHCTVPVTVNNFS
jgi:hypothetical protein